MDDFFKSRALEYHSAGKAGKTSTIPAKPVGNPQELALAYTPGVAAPAIAISQERWKAYRYTNQEALGKSEEDVDLILISYGHNDFGGASIIAPQGEISIENRDTTTYVGAWNVVLEELLERYPNAKIVIVNQWHLTGSSAAQGGLTREEYYHAVVEMYYEYYHEMDRIYLLDAGDTRISGVNMNDADFRARYS